MEKQELQPNEQQLHGAISATERAVAAAAAALEKQELHQSNTKKNAFWTSGVAATSWPDF
jgi:septal ring factor EnvC (AmiA/AmiB activator)